MKTTLGLMLTALTTVTLCGPVLAQLPPATPAPPAAPAVAASVTPAVPAVPAAPPAPYPAPAPLAAAVPPPPAAPAVAAVPALPAPPQAAQRPAPAPKPPKAPQPARAGEVPPAPPEPAKAPEPPSRERLDQDPVNVRFEVTVSSQTGSSPAVKRTALVTVSNGATPGPTGSASLRSGNSVPVPTTTMAKTGESGKETNPTSSMVSFNYRAVGLNVDVRDAVLIPGSRVRARLNIEFSGVDDKASASTGAPSFPTFSQSLSLYLDNGKSVVVAQSSDFVDNVERKQTVEVKATILR